MPSSPRCSTMSGPEPPAPDAILSVRGLTVGYGDEVVLEDVGFDVRRGEVFAILGGSGCGKSTLLKAMIGLLAPVSGTVVIDGDELTTATGARRLAILRKFGMLYQSSALFS